MTHAGPRRSPRMRRTLAAAALAGLALVNVLLAGAPAPAHAEDIDIFTVNPAISALRPNVLIFVDNTANWNTAFVNEKSALVSTVNGLDERFNVGWGGFVETGNPNDNVDGAYIRAAVRQMTPTNKAALSAMVNALDQGFDKGNNATPGLAMAELYRYFRGAVSVSGLKHKRDFRNNSLPTGGNNANNNPLLAASNAVWALPGNAFQSQGATRYSSPISDACQKNFIIFISNGAFNENNSARTTANNALSSAGGSTTEIPLTPNGQQGNPADEWARFMANTDVNPDVTGTQNVITYTIDVNPGSTGQGPAQSALLRSMANVGKGRYFAVSSANGGAQIAAALNEIFQEILAVNSVFAASTLPASVNARGTFLNQVYMGMFRPDGNALPRWAGNLKQYKLGEVAGKIALVDASSPAVAIENQVTGFIRDNVRSFWTQPSSFWNATSYPNVQGAGGISDAPDGPFVEKGGAAHRLRAVHATNVTTRKVYTCTGTCSGGSSLASFPFDTTNTALTASALGAGTADKDEVIRWVRGENRRADDPVGGTTTGVRGYIHGDVVHSKPAIVNYNRAGQPTDRDIWVFYGANDGMLHAVKGGQDDADGYEEWSFIAPEFFGRLGRLYANTPVISDSARKPYFFDGPMSVWTHDANGDGRLTTGGSGDQVILFASARRGGRLLYALDVTDPTAPRLLWRISNASSGFEELGLTFGEVKVATVRGQSDPIAIVSGGYDAAANDQLPQTAATMGRGVFALNARTGALVWRGGGGMATSTTAPVTRTIDGMDAAISADPVVIDSDFDGYADRIYLADTKANIWRVNIDYGGSNAPTTWRGMKVAALGGSGDEERKFLQSVDVVRFDASTDAILVGSGDRENPLDTTIENWFFMVKDANARTYERAAGDVVEFDDLFDATTSTSVPDSALGWKFGLRTGEKVVTSATTLNGATFFSTNRPESTLGTQQGCSTGLGEARDYVVDFRRSAAINDTNADGTIAVADRSDVRPGGGLPPSPVPATVCYATGKCAEVVLSGPTVKQPPAVTIGRRFRTFWNLMNETR